MVISLETEHEHLPIGLRDDPEDNAVFRRTKELLRIIFSDPGFLQEREKATRVPKEGRRKRRWQADFTRVLSSEAYVAFEELMEINMNIPEWVANRIIDHLVADSRQDWEDLLQEATLGLLQAPFTYDPEKGYFRNYAKSQARATALIGEFLNGHGKPTRQQQRVVERYLQTLTVLFQEKGEQPSFDEIIKRMRMRPETVRRALMMLYHSSFDEEVEGKDPYEWMASSVVNSEHLLETADALHLWRKVFITAQLTHNELRAIVCYYFHFDPDSLPEEFENIVFQDFFDREVGETSGKSRTNIANFKASARRKLARAMRVHAVIKRDLVVSDGNFTELQRVIFELCRELNQQSPEEPTVQDVDTPME